MSEEKFSFATLSACREVGDETWRDAQDPHAGFMPFGSNAPDGILVEFAYIVPDGVKAGDPTCRFFQFETINIDLSNTSQ